MTVAIHIVLHCTQLCSCPGASGWCVGSLASPAHTCEEPRSLSSPGVMETANLTHHPEAHESGGYQTGFIDMLQRLIYASLCWSPNWQILKAASSEIEGASQDYANNQHPRCPCARASRVSHSKFTTLQLWALPIAPQKHSEESFLLRQFFKIQWGVFLFLRWSYLIFYLNKAPIHLKKIE